MKIIIAGSRHFDDIRYVEEAVRQCSFNITEVVSGAARGADTLGETWARNNGVKVSTFHAEWYELGKKAGMLRNSAMAGSADGLIAIWDGRSVGTADMIRRMRRLDKPIFIYYPDDPL